MRLSYSPVTLGERVKHFDAGAFALTEAAYPPKLQLPRHAHSSPTISFILDGSCTEFVGKTAHECRPYRPVLKPAGETHSNRYGRSGAKCVLIEIKPDGLEMIRAFSRILDHVSYVQEASFYGLAKRIHREFKIMDSAAALSIEGLVLELMGELTRRTTTVSSPKAPLWLREAREHMDGHFRERISLFRVGALVGIHPAHVARMFRRHYQCTVGEYVRRLRLDDAAKRIAGSADSLSDIAITSGFYDQSHFTHAFKLQMGVTPAEFRDNVQRDKPTKTPRPS